MQRVDIYQGESHIIEYEVTTPDGLPKDLRLYTAEFRLVLDGTEDLLVSKSLGDGIEYLNAEVGLLEVTLSPEDTELSPGRYQRELRLWTAGNAHTADAGPVMIADSLFVA